MNNKSKYFNEFDSRVGDAFLLANISIIGVRTIENLDSVDGFDDNYILIDNNQILTANYGEVVSLADCILNSNTYL